jgi:hypothetical protein
MTNSDGTVSHLVSINVDTGAVAVSSRPLPQCLISIRLVPSSNNVTTGVSV